MKANELRIGNYISPLGIGFTKVEGVCIWDGLIQSSSFAERVIEDFEPIPLTEEWMLKLPKKLKYPIWIKYLHELQNWYYWNNEKKELHINL